MKSLLISLLFLGSCATGKYYDNPMLEEDAPLDAMFIELGDEVMVPERSPLCSKVGRVVAIRRDMDSNQLFYKVKFAVVAEGCYRYRIFSDQANLIKIGL